MQVLPALAHILRYKVPAAQGGGGGAGASTSIAFQTSGVSSGSTITVPAGVIAGDILVMHDFTESSGATPTAVVPTGWTQIGNDTDTGSRRQVTSYKLAVGGDAGATVTGMSDVKHDKMMLVFRPTVAATTLTLGSVHAEGSSPAPSNQLCAASGGTVPLVVLGFWASNGTVSPRGMTITKDGEVHQAANNDTYTDYKIYNSSPADITFSMGDFGQNFLTSCYISAA